MLLGRIGYDDLGLPLYYVLEIVEDATEAEVEMIPSPWNGEFGSGGFPLHHLTNWTDFDASKISPVELLDRNDRNCCETSEAQNYLFPIALSISHVPKRSNIVPSDFIHIFRRISERDFVSTNLCCTTRQLRI